MIPDTLKPEIHVTKIEIQNEIKNTEMKKSDNKCLTSVKIHEILKQENSEEHENNAEIVINIDTAASNVNTMQEHGINAPVTNIYRMEKAHTKVRKAVHGDLGSKKPGIYSNEYWVQCNFGKSADSSPLAYDSSRNSFVAIVLAITSVMLMITASFVGFVYFTDDLRDYFIFDGKPLFFLGMVGILILNYAMICSGCARMLPCSIVILVFAVFFMSLMAAYITARYRTEIIFFAIVATAVVVFVCFCLALTSFDFTSYLLYIIAISLTFSVLVLVVCITTLVTGESYKPLHMVILAVGTLINIAFLIMELQMILGGKAVEISEDDWALAAFMLYFTIMDIFLKILQLVGGLDDD